MVSAFVSFENIFKVFANYLHFVALMIDCYSSRKMHRLAFEIRIQSELVIE